MSAVCGNCGLSHLPIPCNQPLQQCLGCLNNGHIYLFCPFGSKIDDRFQGFAMLCHNCDSWHLPMPCSELLKICPKCGIVGHMDIHCPVNATLRPGVEKYMKVRFAAEHAMGTNQHRLNDAEASVAAMSPDDLHTLRTLCTAIAKDVLDLRKRYDDQTVIEIMSKTVEQDPTLAPALSAALHGLVDPNASINPSGPVLGSPFGGFRQAPCDGLVGDEQRAGEVVREGK